MKQRFTANKLASLGKQQLYSLARNLEIEGRAGLSRAELVKILTYLLVEPPAGATQKHPELPFSPVASKAEPIEAVEKPRRGRPPKATPVVEAPAEKPRRGRPPKAAPVVEAPVEKPRRGRPPKAAPVVEAPVEKPRRGRPPKAAPVVEAPVEKPRRGRPPKTTPVVEAPVEKLRRGRPPKAAPVVEAPVEKPRRGRPPKHNGIVAENAVTFAKTDQAEVVNRQCEEEAAALKRLNRAFAKRNAELPSNEKKKGAAVLEPAVAIPVNLPAGIEEKRVSGRAEQIELERRRKHASLKTTMEIPIFSSPVHVASSTINEADFTGELPEYHDETRIVLQIRDPHWLYTYWELSSIERKRLELEVGIFEFAHSHFVLRLHNVTRGYTNEIKLGENARNWYIHCEHAQCVYQVELGLQSPTEGYTFVALSNLVQTPPDRVSEHWAEPVPPVAPAKRQDSDHINEDRLSAELAPAPAEPPTAYLTDPAYVYFSSITGDPIPHGGSSELLAGQSYPASEIPESQKAHEARLPAGDSSHSLPTSLSLQHLQLPTSPVAPFSGPSSDSLSSFNLVERPVGQTCLSLSADLLVYGRAPLGCRLYFMGRQIDLNADGSFTLRLALPENNTSSFELTVEDIATGQQKKVQASFTFNKQ